MARKFNNPPSNKKQQGGGSYNNSPPRNARIQKETKKEQPKNNHQPHKITPPPSNTAQNSQKFIPPPPPQPPVQTKQLTDTGKNNLAKLASINKLMGTNIPAANPKIIANQTITTNHTKSSIRKPTPQQVSQVIQSLKDLQKLLDSYSYDDLEIDNKSDLKTLLSFIEERNIMNNDSEKQEKVPT